MWYFRRRARFMAAASSPRFGHGISAPFVRRSQSQGAIKAVRVFAFRGAVAQLGARLDGIEEVAGSNPAGSTKALRRAFRFFANPVHPCIAPRYMNKRIPIINKEGVAPSIRGIS